VRFDVNADAVALYNEPLIRHHQERSLGGETWIRIAEARMDIGTWKDTLLPPLADFPHELAGMAH